MTTEDIAILTGTWFNFAKLVGYAGTVERLEDSFVAIGLFRMAESGDVFFEVEVGDEDGVRRFDF